MSLVRHAVRQGEGEASCPVIECGQRQRLGRAYLSDLAQREAALAAAQEAAGLQKLYLHQNQALDTSSFARRPRGGLGNGHALWPYVQPCVAWAKLAGQIAQAYSK
jgi:hypothetical protein